MLNTLTIDVEDYYMVSAFANRIKFEDWHKFESRVEKNTYILLDLLDLYGVRATFFILGWVAEQHPGLVKEIDRRGHELASHGYNHRLVYELTPQEFREDTRKSKGIIEDIAGKPVIGYRATSFSITERSIWALDILIEEGLLYDSSIFPIRHDRYGMPNAERFPHPIRLNGRTLIEFPPSTYSIFGCHIPIAGGGYLRLFPGWFTNWAIRRLNENEGQPAVIYIHPWEIDTDQPRLNAKFLSRIRHYANINSTEAKLKTLIERFRFRPISYFLNTQETIIHAQK